MRIFLFISVLFLFATGRALHGQVLINEIAAANANGLADEDGDFEDWIELYNNSASPANTLNYKISDDSLIPDKWVFPSITMPSYSYLLLFASGKDRKVFIDHWETAVYSNDLWKYQDGINEPDTNWRNLSFDDSGWFQGMGGVGYGDGDDSTVIAPTSSVFLRRTFTVFDTGKIALTLLHVDYDDAFVVYLNGIEIARSNIGIYGDRPAYDELAYEQHEAVMYQGFNPKPFLIDRNIFKAAVQNGTNVLAVQVHNVDPFSSDLSGNIFLSFGIKDGSFSYGTPPAWFSYAAQAMHTNFKISSTGETIYLRDAAGTIIDQKSLGLIQTDNSIGRQPDGSNSWCTFNTPTPNASNDASICYSGYATEPVFSLAPGFYLGTQVTGITTSFPSSYIRYTTDGTDPNGFSPIYTAPITISTTQTIRARTFNTGAYLPSKSASNTYLIDEFSTLPVISVSTNPENLWDWNNGIYVYGPNADTVNYPFFGSNFWNNWEKPCHVEYFDTSGNQGFELDAGLKIHGNWSRGYPQKGFRILAREGYGTSYINYQLFPEKNVTQFKNFNLRTGGIDNASYSWNGTHFRDDLMNRVVRKTNIDIMDSQPCLLFLNGAYWGVYEIRERQDKYYLQGNWGVDPEKVDLLRYDGDVMEGSNEGFLNMVYFIRNYDMSDPFYYEIAKSVLDIENFCDYFIAETYYANADWIYDGGGVNNTRFWRVNDPPGKWRYMLWDTDGGLGGFTGVDYDLLSVALNPLNSNHSAMIDGLLKNTDFKNYFVNRYADLINTTFHPNNLGNYAIQMAIEIYPEMPRQFARWANDTTEWINHIIGMLDFINQRPAYARAYIQSQFSLPGQVNVTLDVSPPGAGYIKINTIFPDSLPWRGIYFDGVPITMTAVPAPGFEFQYWQSGILIPSPDSNQSVTLNVNIDDLFTAYFTGTPQAPKITFNEINYNSEPTRDAGDWIELHNYGNFNLNISNWTFKDGNNFNVFTIPFGTVLKADEYLVLCADTAKFKSQYPGITNVMGPFNFGLDGKGETVRLFDLENSLILSMAYDDTLTWPQGADGTGRTLELIDPAGNLNDGANWFDGCMGGSPGTAYSPCSETVVFSEINYNSSSGIDTDDWIEIRNIGIVDMDISDWTFKGNNEMNSFTIPSGTVLSANENLVLCANVTKFQSRFPEISNVLGDFSFGLSSTGEELRLFDNQNRIYLSVIYDEQSPWPVSANGSGRTLELKDSSGVMNSGKNWFAGCMGGSPGKFYTPCSEDTNDSSEGLEISFYPNPFGTSATLQVNNLALKMQGLNFALYDMLGRKVKQVTVINNITQIKRDNLIPGLYIYTVADNNNILAKGKVVVQ